MKRLWKQGIEAHEAVVTELQDYAPGMRRWLESKDV